ncbi:MAG: glycosyltransferase family 9 protein [FCB group bacterium]|nr:glycosyltransferase family 9 protein [FCB group bacterium]
MLSAKNSPIIPRQILLVRFSSIGDIVQSTCVAGAIKRTWPDSILVFLVLEKFSPLLENHPFIDEIICLPRTIDIAGLRRLGYHLQSRNFDLVFDLHKSLRSRIILSVMTENNVYSIRKPRLDRWLLTQWHWNRFPQHWTYRHLFFQPLTEAGITYQNTDTPALGIAQEEIELAKRYLKSQGIEQPYIVCIPGAAWSQKTLPVDTYMQAWKRLAPMPVVILGTRRDAICFRLAEKLPEACNLAGKTPLRQSLAILANAQKVIGSDTGLVHAAEALGVPVTMILGPTTKEMGGSTWRPDSYEIATKLWCRPCSQNGKRPCYRSRRYCMTQIEPQQITATMESVTP